jgi:predicted ATPase/DNA-binding CsgD family transcriptional regulator/transcriptional regulator with XRE-family HTH domain
MAEAPAQGFAGLLRQLRAQAGMTQEELAGAARLSTRSVSDLERGINRTARKDTAWLLANALGLADPVRALFIGAARGRVSAAEVLAAMQGDTGGASSVVAAWTSSAVGDSGARGVHGFASTLTSFVGRATALREVADLLAQYRLVTVTGPGGSGKTRLAEEVAKPASDRFADGVWLAELAAVRDPAQIPAVVAAALGVRDQPGVPTVEALARMLARRQLLLILDNCEHVIGAAAGLCAGLLPACDELRVLATSREPMRVAGEARYRLAPLTLPGPDDPADVAVMSEAVALFVDRARRVDARFTLDRETGSAVARLVARLDGMPLAIELAAARVEALGVAQLLDRLDDRFELLAGGNRLAAGRHRSLAAAVDWSYRLLDDNEQRVFRAMSVFPGPFTLAAAEAVAGKSAGQAVLRLVECSLLGSPMVGPDGRTRYRMLETLRAYGGGLLAEAGEQDDTAAVLAAYALQVAEEAAAGLLTSPGKLAAAHWLDAEDATMREVLAWAMEHDTDLALQLAVALAPWWWLRGQLAGGSLTAWAALATLQRHERFTDARPDERGAAMRRGTVAESASMLTTPSPQQFQEPPGLGKLSARERELVTLVAQGRTDAQIAAQLDISVRTVHTHLDRVRDKTGCRRRADLTRLALESGLV